MCIRTLAAAGLLAALSTLTTLSLAATVQVTVLARDGNPLPDAVVVLETADGRPVTAAPASVHTITQERMQFVPAVSVVPAGTRVTFTNLDRFDHHVRGGPAGLQGAGAPAGFEFRLSGAVPGQEPPSHVLTLERSGPVQLGCHLHGSMRGFVYVAATPWAVKTSADGVALLPQVPEGPMRLRVWHPDQLVEQTAITIEVQPVTALSVPTQIQPRRARRAAQQTPSVY
jgi:plastocyanin